MQRRERLMATLRGEALDRPAVCFYEINGLDEDVNNPDPFNIYSDPSWAPVIELARAKTERIVMRSLTFCNQPPSVLDKLTRTEQWLDEYGRRFERKTVQAGKRTLTSLTRRDPDVNTLWTVEHLLKNVEDLDAYLNLPVSENIGEFDPEPVLQAEAALGDSGIVMLDTPDPLCQAAALFHMGEYTVIALTERQRFHRLLERLALKLHAQAAAAAQALPGRLWRIYGPEYAAPPFLPPRLFREYVVAYDRPMIEVIQHTGGFARIHSHGRLKVVLDDIAATGCDALDPIEPPPQGDVSLAYVRERYGEQMVLFGNLEANDIENLPVEQFRQKVRAALEEGQRGRGRGFVLMPSACPYGRKLPPLAFENYCCMVEEVAG